MEKVSVVIPHWNGSAILRGCLESLRAQTFRDFVTYVVDNGSSDDSAAMVASEFPEVRLVQHERNLGFCGAMNTGITTSGGDYVVALNNDTEQHPDWLAKLVAAMDADPEAGFGTCKVLDFANREIVDTVGDGYAFWGTSYKIASQRPHTVVPAEPFDVFGASGAAAIYRRSMLDRIGHFDPDLFAYMEDVDLSIRARLAGYRCLSVPDAVVYHMGAASTGGSTSDFSVRLTARNVFTVILKDMPGPLLPAVLAATVVAQAAAVGLAALTGRPGWARYHRRAYGEGLMEAIRSVPASLRKRRGVQSTRSLSWIAFCHLLADSARLRRKLGAVPRKTGRG